MRTMRAAQIVLIALALGCQAALAQPAPVQDPNQAFTPGELINAGHRFFGTRPARLRHPPSEQPRLHCPDPPPDRRRVCQPEP